VPNLFQNIANLFAPKPTPPQEPRRRDPDATLPLPPLAEARPTSMPPKAAPGAMPKRLTLGIAQDVGKVRSHNEDVLLVFTGELGGLEAMPNFGLFVVADGMGGHSLGEPWPAPRWIRSCPPCWPTRRPTSSGPCSAK